MGRVVDLGYQANMAFRVLMAETVCGAIAALKGCRDPVVIEGLEENLGQKALTGPQGLAAIVVSWEIVVPTGNEDLQARVAIMV